ncbi:MAG TPA: hypothetical protein VFJ72_02485 [Rubrobacteraceae bacterium]|nr:hypothetical protein [Rubrobacteraceae bacterium]
MSHRKTIVGILSAIVALYLLANHTGLFFTLALAAGVLWFIGRREPAAAPPGFTAAPAAAAPGNHYSPRKDSRGPGDVASDAGSAAVLSRMLQDLCRDDSSEGYDPRPESADWHGVLPPLTSGATTDPAPDYAQALIGYREWAFVPRIETTSGFRAAPDTLFSLTRQANGTGGSPLAQRRERYHEWPLDGPHEARCGVSGLLPSRGNCPSCTCGFYAWSEELWPICRPGQTLYGTEPFSWAVPGIIAGWGKVSIHQRGFRCQYARVVALLDPGAFAFDDPGEPGWPDPKTAYLDLIGRKGVPLISPDEMLDPDLPARFGLLRASQIT